MVRSIGRMLGKGILALAIVGGLAVAADFIIKSQRAAASPPPQGAIAPPPVVLGKSGLPLPRFVTLKAGRVNVRVGPGEDYKVAWVFTKPGLPVEIIQEFDTWRRIRDSDGAVGWVFHSLLTGKRNAVVSPWSTGPPLPIRTQANEGAAVTAYLEPGVQAGIDKCAPGWCRVSGKGFSGWIAQSDLWGVYPGEDVD
jgi:SH3-like domain-containing protein